MSIKMESELMIPETPQADVTATEMDTEENFTDTINAVNETDALNTTTNAAVLEIKEEEINCEQILLPPEVITTNGGAEDDAPNAEEFCDEQDPMADVTEHEIKVLENTAQNVAIGETMLPAAEDEVEAEQKTKNDDDENEENMNAVTEKELNAQTLPKKRKCPNIAQHSVANLNVDIKTEVKEEVENNKNVTETNIIDDKDTNIKRNNDKEDQVDEEQCRVCTTKLDLVCIFKVVDQLTVAEMLMTICPTVTIARKDFMPQYICNPCLDNVTIAMQLKTQCETTERELRKKLSRSKNKIRRPTGYVVIDAPLESDPQSEDETNDDVEFKVSEASVSAEDDSEDTDLSEKKKRTTRSVTSRRVRRKAANSITSPQSRVPKDKKRIISSAKNPAFEYVGSSDNDTEESVTAFKRKKAKKSKRSHGIQIEYPCDECHQIFTRKLSLVLHKKSHTGGRNPINCEVCGKQFKIQGAYRTHLEKHRDGSISFECDKCEKHFPSKSDVRRHLANEHNDTNTTTKCDKCKRTFVSESRLMRHLDGRCPGFECKSNAKKSDYEGFALGRDLFKSVAPLKTTYWSDSFSD